jgi:hypothetical protein
MEPAMSPPDGDGSFELDWLEVEHLIPLQPATMVYTNPREQIVIRQDGTGLNGEDQFVFFNVENLPVLIAVLGKYLSANRTLGRPSNGEDTKRDRTAAERKRRQRNRDRHADVTPVTQIEALDAIRGVT